MTYGVESFRKYRFVQQKTILAATIEAHKRGFVVKKSLIPNAGNGVFCGKKSFDGGLVIMNYIGEPMEKWIYDAIEVVDELFTGITFKTKIGNGVWRGIPRTLGASINSSMHEKDANVEFIVNHAAIDSKTKTLFGANFMQIRVKEGYTIRPGEELLLYYGSNFWKDFKAHKETFCAICLLYYSNKSDPMYLCDGRCLKGFHAQCLIKLHLTLPCSNCKKWLCPNCT